MSVKVEIEIEDGLMACIEAEANETGKSIAQVTAEGNFDGIANKHLQNAYFRLRGKRIYPDDLVAEVRSYTAAKAAQAAS